MNNEYTQMNIYNEQVQCPSLVVTTKSNLLPIHKARTQFQSSDVLVPFKGTANGTSDDGEALHRLRQIKNCEFKLIPRFYHVFEQGEMAQLARETGMFTIIDEIYDDGNYVLFLTR